MSAVPKEELDEKLVEEKREKKERQAGQEEGATEGPLDGCADAVVVNYYLKGLGRARPLVTLASRHQGSARRLICRASGGHVVLPACPSGDTP